MKVIVTTIFAINPSIIRIKLYTCDENNIVCDYDLAIPVDLFTTVNDETKEVEVDLGELQKVISARIIDAQNIAMLAKYIDEQNLEWDLIVDTTKEKEKESPLDNTKLAYGEKKLSDNT